ncbi:MAG TPA: hypothetical protein VH165_27860 [Kofleriaceae bacterium]|jgi:hypothetical protein|nr:hypothetical protein [Kofleriaceae bacterium]
MAQPNLALTPRAEALTGSSAELPAELPADDAAWKDVLQLLRKAAKLAAERGVESDLFMQATWAACLEARPGLREELEDKELRSQLKKLRKRGMVGKA